MESFTEKIQIQDRVVYSLFFPAVRIAGVFGIPLKDMKNWLSVAYLHEMKRKGCTQMECASRMDVSRRTIINLSSDLKRIFLREEKQNNLERRIVFLLWAEAVSKGRLVQALEGEFEKQEIEAALEALIEEKKVRTTSTRSTVFFALNRHSFRLVKDNWIAKLDALSNQLSGLSDTVFAKFFTNEPRAFTRTVGLSVRKKDAEEIQRFYRNVIYPKLEALDEASQMDPEAELFEFLISWVPKDFIEQYEKEKKI